MLVAFEVAVERRVGRDERLLVFGNGVGDGLLAVAFGIDGQELGRERFVLGEAGGDFLEGGRTHFYRIERRTGGLVGQGGGASVPELDEVEHGVVNKWRIWWVQAEGVVGFLNAYQKYGNARYLEISHALWEYIKNNIIDPREGGEWYSQVDEQGNYAKFKPEVDPWKCPYHNGRMCLEVIKRS